MRTKFIFLFLFGFWLVDFITTLFILARRDYLIEGNSIPRMFIEMGFVGWILLIMIVTLMYYGFSYLMFWSSNYAKRKGDFDFLIIYVPIVIYCLSEFWIILANFLLYLGYFVPT